jgi:hypothetical protein
LTSQLKCAGVGGICVWMCVFGWLQGFSLNFNGMDDKFLLKHFTYTTVKYCFYPTSLLKSIHLNTLDSLFEFNVTNTWDYHQFVESKLKVNGYVPCFSLVGKTIQKHFLFAQPINERRVYRYPSWPAGEDNASAGVLFFCLA